MRARSFLVLCCLVPLPAQSPAPTDPQRALRFARQLELPGERSNAVSALLRLGDAAVPALLQQARHPDLDVARTAFMTLAALGHAGLAAVPALRELAGGTGPHAEAAAWTLARLPHRGTFLVPSMDEGVVRELDGDGVEIWKSKSVGKVWTAQILANGNLLAADVGGGVREYDEDGKVVWEHAAAAAYTAERLIDGNTLVIAFTQKRVFELDPGGETVWSFDDVQSLCASRLPDGRTLIADYTGERVIEVDRDGHVAWQIEKVPHCYGARRLRDGSTAVMQQQQNLVRIYDPAGKAIEDVKLSRSSSDYVPLPDGSMQCGHRFVRRCDKDGNEIWKVDVGGWVGRVTLR